MQLKTITELSSETGLARHRISYALRTQGIEPERRIGNTNVFSEVAVQRVLEALADNMLGRTSPMPEVMA